jgi:RNA polymerase sigma factor for flagellar operon FliA
VADESGLGVDAVRRTRDAAANATLARLDDTARRGGSGPAEALAELLLCPATGAEQRVEDIEMRLMVGGALGALDDRARRIICAIYLEGRVQQDIADELGITESRVSQIHHATLHVLGDMLAVYLPERAANRPEPKAAAGRERRSRSATQAIARYRAWYEQQRGGLVAA